MEIVVGKLAGFCGGVINSVKKTEEYLDANGMMYCLGELVHNKQVVDNLESKGLITISDLNEVPSGSKVIVRAHGIQKSTYELANSKNILFYDLTCPNVLLIHDKASKLEEEGYFIVLIAKKDHPEAIGTISFCGDDSVILEDNLGIDNVIDLFKKSTKDKMAVISQTTYSMSKFDALSEELKNRLVGHEVLVDNTICSATELRQKETEKLSKEVDAMIIIGGKNSSNTKKLYDISCVNCSNSFIVEKVDELIGDFSSFNKIGVMAGASTPKESIIDVINYLESIKK